MHIFEGVSVNVCARYAVLYLKSLIVNKMQKCSILRLLLLVVLWDVTPNIEIIFGELHFVCYPSEFLF